MGGAMSRARVVIVGVCASGKTTLVEDLRRSGVDALSVAQEHSQAPRLWQHPQPDFLVVLEAGLDTIRQRRRVSWGMERLRAQRGRLEHARQNGWLILETDGLRPDLVASAVREALRREGALGPDQGQLVPGWEEIARHPRLAVWQLQAGEGSGGPWGAPVASMVSRRAGDLLRQLGYPETEARLAEVAGFLHALGPGEKERELDPGEIISELGLDPDMRCRLEGALERLRNPAGASPGPKEASIWVALNSLVGKGDAKGKEPECLHLSDGTVREVESSRLQADLRRKTIVWELEVGPQPCLHEDRADLRQLRGEELRQAALFLGCKFETAVIVDV